MARSKKVPAPLQAVKSPEEVAAQRLEKQLAIRAILRTAVPPRIEVLKRSSFDVVISRYEAANNDLQRHMRSGLLGQSKKQTGEAFVSFVTAIAACAFAQDGVTILDEHFQEVHPEIQAARKQGRVLGMESLLGFLGALTGTRREPDRPTLVRGMPTELRAGEDNDALARKRLKFGIDG